MNLFQAGFRGNDMKRSMKKTLRQVILALALAVLLVFAGCGKKNNVPGETSDEISAETLSERTQADEEEKSDSADKNDTEKAEADEVDAEDPDHTAEASGEDSSRIDDENDGSTETETSSGGKAEKETGGLKETSRVSETVKKENAGKETTKAAETTKAPETTKAAETTKAPETTKTAGGSVTISIVCHTILNNPDLVKDPYILTLAGNGTILGATSVSFTEGESVFDILNKACRAAGIQLEYSYTPLYNSSYIEGINNIYEFDAGDNSGWMYCVNGWFPNYGCSSYYAEDGDVIEWIYSCDRGNDIGGGVGQGN